MRVRALLINGLVLGCVGWMVGLGGLSTQPARLLPAKQKAAPVEELESRAALAPTLSSTADLATAYLDRDQPGLATAVIERAPREIRSRPEVAQLHARALFQRGRAREALAVARDASEACAEGGACPTWLLARTSRQVAYFEQVVAAGIDDPMADPAATRAAYERSNHEVRLVAMR
jgi:hypothetical protein